MIHSKTTYIYSAHAKFNTISKLKWIDFQIKVNKHTIQQVQVKSIFLLNFKSNENKIVKTFQLSFEGFRFH